MRILLVTDGYPPLLGGANVDTQQLAQGMTQRGHHVTVATSWEADLPSDDRDGSVRVVRIRDSTTRVPGVRADPSHHTPPPFPDPEAILRLRGLIDAERPELIHSYGWLSYSALAAARDREVAFLLSARDYGNFCAVRTLVKSDGSLCDGPALAKCLACAGEFYGRAKGAVAVLGVLGSRRSVRRRVNALHHCSTYVQGQVHQHLFDAAAHGLPDVAIPSMQRVAQPAEAPSDLPTTPYILFVGALRKVKGIEVLLHAYEKMTNPPPLVVVGMRAPDTPLFPANVKVYEDVPPDVVMRFWDGALFGVAPSVWPEPFGNVVHEAMSRGKTVIGTKPGGHADMIDDGVNGLLVPSGDIGALSYAMQQLVDNAELRERLSRAARVRAEAFTPELLLPVFERLYETTLTCTREREKAT